MILAVAANAAANCPGSCSNRPCRRGPVPGDPHQVSWQRYFDKVAKIGLHRAPGLAAEFRGCPTQSVRAPDFNRLTAVGWQRARAAMPLLRHRQPGNNGPRYRRRIAAIHHEPVSDMHCG